MHQHIHLNHCTPCDTTQHMMDARHTVFIAVQGNIRHSTMHQMRFHATHLTTHTCINSHHMQSVIFITPKQPLCSSCAHHARCMHTSMLVSHCIACHTAFTTRTIHPHPCCDPVNQPSMQQQCTWPINADATHTSASGDVHVAQRSLHCHDHGGITSTDASNTNDMTHAHATSNANAAHQH